MLRYPELICAAVPELAPARGFDQRSVYHAFNVYEHIARVLTVAGELALCDGVAPSSSLMWAAFLHDVRSRGVRAVLGSASKNAGTILDRCGLRPLFDAVVDGNEVARAKPDPEVFLKGAAAVGAAPSVCVVFEDAAAGIEAASRAGRCVAFGRHDAAGNLRGIHV